MPTWVLWIVGIAALVTSCGTLWTKVLNPLRRAGNKAERMYPLLVTLTETFAAHPHYFGVLDQIADQFKTNHGSSLMDIVRDLQVAAAESKNAAEVLKVGVEAARVLAERDREQLMRLIILIDRLDAKVSGGRDALDRVEMDRARVADDLAANELDLAAARAEVAANLARAQGAVDGVANDLAASHRRADAVDGTPGAAADAASRSAGSLEAAMEAARAQWMERQRSGGGERRVGDPAAERAYRDSGLPERRQR